MSVAKSFQNFEFLTEPYNIGGKLYIKVKNPKTGTIRQVRWYEEDSLMLQNKYYSPATQTTHEHDPYYRTQKHLLGFFPNDFIYILEPKHWRDYQNLISLNTKFWKGFATKRENVPAHKLYWSEVGDPQSERLKSEEEVRSAVARALWGDCKPGDKIQITAAIKKRTEVMTTYGLKTSYLMEDSNGNLYNWITASKKTTFQEGKTYEIAATIKEHKITSYGKTTILTYCKEL